jgi:putative hydrolase of the HAD superfamily
MIRALIFDCFGVLYEDDIQTLYDLMGPEQLEDAHELVRKVDIGSISVAEFIDGIAALSQCSSEEIREIINIPHDRNADLFDYIKELKGTYKIGLLSNVNTEAIDRIFPKIEREELFDAIALSSEVGLLKPDAEIYALVAKQLNLPTDACVYVDDIAANVDGARRVGMKGIVFIDNNQLKADLASILETSHA